MDNEGVRQLRKVKKNGQWERTITYLFPNQVLKGPPFFETLLMKHSLLKKEKKLQQVKQQNCLVIAPETDNTLKRNIVPRVSILQFPWSRRDEGELERTDPGNEVLQSTAQYV